MDVVALRSTAVEISHGARQPARPASPHVYAGEQTPLVISSKAILSSLHRARRMTKRRIIFVLVATLLLPLGCVGAQMVWYCFHHRYDSPETGLYHGYVTVLCDSWDEPFYSLHIKAESSPRWYWRQPTNFSYTTIEVEWRDEAVDRHATVSLHEFTYHTDGASGALTRDVLAGWLFGAATNRVTDRHHLDAVFGCFQAAADGSLPRPRHHTYYLEQASRVRIQHFLLGYGVGSTVYIWSAVWLFLVVIVGRKILRWSHEG
jgi:hypothetical protein